MSLLRSLIGGFLLFVGFVCCLITFGSSGAEAIKFGLLGVQVLLIALILQVAQGQQQNDKDSHYR